MDMFIHYIFVYEYIYLICPPFVVYAIFYQADDFLFSQVGRFCNQILQLFSFMDFVIHFKSKKAFIILGMFVV